jgi:hypothetical protein
VAAPRPGWPQFAASRLSCKIDPESRADPTSVDPGVQRKRLAPSHNSFFNALLGPRARSPTRSGWQRAQNAFPTFRLFFVEPTGLQSSLLVAQNEMFLS